MRTLPHVPGSDLLDSSVPCLFWQLRAPDASKAGFDDSFIYREIAQPHAQRGIPMIQMMRQEALAAFRAWEEKPNKIPY